MRNIADIVKDDRDGKELSQTERQIAVAYIQGKYDAVRELNLVGNSNKWIPVSEQLPDLAIIGVPLVELISPEVITILLNLMQKKSLMNLKNMLVGVHRM